MGIIPSPVNLTSQFQVTLTWEIKLSKFFWCRIFHEMEYTTNPPQVSWGITYINSDLIIFIRFTLGLAMKHSTKSWSVCCTTHPIPHTSVCSIQFTWRMRPLQLGRCSHVLLYMVLHIWLHMYVSSIPYLIFYQYSFRLLLPWSSSLTLATLWGALVNPVMTTLLNLIITTLLNLVMTTLLNLIMTTLLSLIVTTLLNLINLPKV